MKYRILTALAAAMALSACGTPATKVLVDHSFRGKDKTSKMLLQANGREANKKPLYDTYVRMCNLDERKEVACKDTVILEDVVSQSVY